MRISPALETWSRAFPVADSAWTETGITYANARSGRDGARQLRALTAGSYFAIDVTAGVPGNGTFSFLVNTGSTTSASSRVGG